MKRASRTRSRGISTIEILVGSTLSLMALAALFSAFHGQSQALATQNAYAQTQDITRTVVDLMVRDIRMASYDPTNTALTAAPGPNCPGARQGITEATPTRIHFKQDLNGDGLTTAANEDITYNVVSGELRRTDAAGSTAVLTSGLGATSFGLRYFTADNPPVELVPSGNPTALTSGQRDCVAEVQITMNAIRANPNPNNATTLHSLATSRVATRNRTLSNL